MTPYFERDGIQLYHGDCREILPTIASGATAVITDPPYNVGKDYGTWSDALAPGDFQRLLEAVARCGVDTQAWVTPHVRLAEFIGALGTPYPVAVQRRAQGPIRGGWSDQFLLILVRGVPRRRFSNLWQDIRLRDEGYLCTEDAYGHPGYTPYRIMARLIDLLTAPGDLVIEPFCGTGTTLRAAMDFGRRAIGIEVDERYCEIAARRLDQMTMPLEFVS